MKTTIKFAMSLVLLTTACNMLAPNDEAEAKSNAGLSNVTAISCALAGGSCRAASECAGGGGSIGSEKYSCGGSRRVCCFATCGNEVENVECCNSEHTYAPRPTCTDGKLSCPAGTTKVPLGTCVPKTAMSFGD